MRQCLGVGLGDRGKRGSVSSDAVREGPRGTSSLRHFRTTNEFNDRDGGNDPGGPPFSLVIFLLTDAD